MKLRLLVLALMVFCTQQLLAQAKTVTGTVKDKETGEALAGAAVVLESTSKGVFTDLDGKYSLAVNSDADVIVFNLIGYTPIKITVGNQTVIDVALETNVQLDEVVITALGIPRDKKALGYATQIVNGSEVSTAKEANLVNAMQGKVAGVQITGSSNLGGSSRILIRGAKSISGNNQPLFVVDGVPIDNGNYTTTDQARGALGYDYGNAAQDINPADIEDIQVLRGPAAAVYGSRGANGVILITTKKGKQNKGKGKMPIGVSLNQTWGFDKVFVLPDYQNLYGGGPSAEFDSSGVFEGLVHPNFSYDGSWGPALNGQQVLQWYAYDQKYHPELYGKTTPWEAHPDNVKDFFRTGQTSTTNISLDGANDVANFRLSLSNFNQKGVFENSRLNRNTVSFNGNQKLGEKFTAGITMNYVRSAAKGRPQTGYSNIASNFTQWWQRQLDIEDMREYRNPDGTQRSWNRQSETNSDPLYWDNPFWTLYQNYETDQRDRVFGNVNGTYKINNNLSLRGTVMSDYYVDFRQERIAKGSVSSSMYSEDRIRYNENNYELLLNYSKNIGEDHSFNAFAGSNRRDLIVDRLFQQTQGGLNIANFYSLENAVSGVTVDPNKSLKRVNSLFGGINYGYKNFLYVDVTGRNDWSSTLPDGNNSYFYPSVSTSLIYSELMKWEPMSYGKLRFGISQVGNDTDPYRLATLPSPGQSVGTDPLYYAPSTVNNPNLRPEKVSTWEVGTEMAFFVDRIKFDFTYYQTRTTDMIFNVQQSASTGYNFRVTNAGEMVNKGIEMALNTIIVRRDNGFEFGMGAVFSRNRNEVVELYKDENGNEVTSVRLVNAPFAVSLQAIPGQPYGTIVGTDYATYNGQRLVDGGFYVPTSTVQPLGSVLADFTGGINLHASYKGFYAYALFDFQKGGSLYSLTNTWGKYSGTLAETAEGNIRENGIIVDGVNLTGYDDNGNPVSDGSANTTSVAAVDHFFANQGYVIAAADVYDASFIKFREMRLMYEFPKKMFEKTPIQGMTFGITGRNLAILKKNVPHIDPESAVSSGNIQGLEGGQLPSTRNISFTLGVKF